MKRAVRQCRRKRQYSPESYAQHEKIQTSKVKARQLHKLSVEQQANTVAESTNISGVTSGTIPITVQPNRPSLGVILPPKSYAQHEQVQTSNLKTRRLHEPSVEQQANTVAESTNISGVTSDTIPATVQPNRPSLGVILPRKSYAQHEQVQTSNLKTRRLHEPSVEQQANTVAESGNISYAISGAIPVTVQPNRPSVIVSIKGAVNKMKLKKKNVAENGIKGSITVGKLPDTQRVDVSQNNTVHSNSICCKGVSVEKDKENIEIIDLTGETPTHPATSTTQHNVQRIPFLPYHCDLCTALYPTVEKLSCHRQTYHKIDTASIVGVPLINLNDTNIRKLTEIGVTKYISLSSSVSADQKFALPVVPLTELQNSYASWMRNIVSTVINLGPVHSLSNS